MHPSSVLNITNFFFEKFEQEHLTQAEIDGLEKLRSLLFHHSWKTEEALLATDIKLDKSIIYYIKSTEVLGSRKPYSLLDSNDWVIIHDDQSLMSERFEKPNLRQQTENIQYLFKNIQKRIPESVFQEVIMALKFISGPL